jgi:hypothetical protein
VDDFLIIYDQRILNVEETLSEINEKQPIIKFAMEKKSQNSINFLGISV